MKYEVLYKRDEHSLGTGTQQGKQNSNEVFHMIVQAENVNAAEHWAEEYQKKCMNRDIRILYTNIIDDEKDE